jgi:hypothetical protein
MEETRSSADQQLISEFVAAFYKLNDCLTCEGDPDPVRSALAVGGPDEHGYRHWQAVRVKTDRLCLENLYIKLPARLPHLYEQLILSYRWAEVDLGSFTLLANPPGEGFDGLLQQIHFDDLLEAGSYVRFARGCDVDYDPVCFDLGKRRQGGDCPIVKLDHEEILCNSRIREVTELAPSFRDLIVTTIEAARKPRTP